MINMSSIRKHYKMRIQQIKESDIEKGQVILVGDCVFDNIQLNHLVEGGKIQNNGICGDTTVLLMETLFRRVIKYKPSTLFLSIGSNDIGFDHRDVKQIYNNIVSIVEDVKKRSPKTKIIILSVLPVNPVYKNHIKREYVDERSNFDINMVNYYLRNYASRNRLKFVNLNNHLANNFEQLNLDYTSDGFHLNEKGYEVLSNVILDYV